MSEVLNDLLVNYLDEIRACFKVPVKVTLLVRVPSMEDADSYLTNDQPEEAIAAMRRLSTSPQESTDG